MINAMGCKTLSTAYLIGGSGMAAIKKLKPSQLSNQADGGKGKGTGILQSYFRLRSAPSTNEDSPDGLNGIST